MVVRVWKVLHTFEPARKVYERVLSRATTWREREIAKNVTCLLLWLEMILGATILDNVATMARNSVTLSRVVDEADAIHSYVHEGFYWLPPELGHLPTIVALCCGGRLIDFRFFELQRDIVKRGLAMIRNTVATLIFDDRLYEMLRRFQDELELSAVNPRPAPELLEAVVFQRTPAADSRTVFISFPQDPPLSSQEIKDYFERHLGFGHCIEIVPMDQPSPWETHRPKHGVIVFRSVQLRDEVMRNQTGIFFRVAEGHYMWAQRYQPLC